MVKKIVSLVSSGILLCVAGVAFAKAEVSCPPAEQVRSQGTTLIRGYMDNQANDYLWTFYSTPFRSDPPTPWQTYFEENLPGITDPSVAIQKAQRDLNNLALSTYVTSYTTSDNVTVCEYAPRYSNYKVTVVNHIDAAIKARR